VTDGDTVVDVGAHVGHHALVAARRAGRDGRVITIDPQPYNADRISRHAALNGLANMTTICAAAGTDDRFIKLPVQSKRDRSRLSLHEPEPNDLAFSVEVPLRRLDASVAQHGIHKIALLKIDVEGYELEVLQGLGVWISDCRNIILEMLDATDASRNRAVVDPFIAAGFVLKDVTDNTWQWGAPLPENNLWAARL
jgi:FkbM family methyltransferase